jgi:hypothetical protein
LSSWTAREKKLAGRRSYRQYPPLKAYPLALYQEDFIGAQALKGRVSVGN